MPPVLSRLRRTHPYLTPGFFPDDEEGELAQLIPRLLRQPGADGPEFSDSGGVPALRRPPLHDIDRIAALGEENPLPMGESDVPLLSRPIQMPQARPQPPTVTYDQGGRPTPTVFGGTGDPEQRVMARRRALEQYQPQKESKKSLALRTLLSFVGGGLAGRGGVAETLLGPGGVLDRRGKDRAWQQEQLSGVYGQLDRTRADRRAGLQDDLLESQVLENRADAAAKMRARAVPPIKDIEVGGYLLRPNPTTGGYDTVYSPPSKPADLFAGAQDVEDGEGNVIMVGRDGKPILNPTTNQPFVRRRRPEPKAASDGKPDTSASQREAIQANIAAAEAEKKTLGPAPPPTFTESWGETKVNPAYTDWASRFRKLDDDIRNWKADLSKVPTVTTARRSSSVTEQQVRDAATKKGLNADEAVKRARSRGMIR